MWFLNLRWFIWSGLNLIFFEIIIITWTHLRFIFVNYIWRWCAYLSRGLSFVGWGRDFLLDFAGGREALVRYTISPLSDCWTVLAVVRGVQSIRHSLIADFFYSIFKVQFKLFYLIFLFFILIFVIFIFLIDPI